MKKTVLLLEDDRQLNDTIRQFLEYHGYEVIPAYDGLTAQEIVYEKHIDLMLLDIKVPELDGFAVLKSLREKGVLIPAIYITSLNSVEDVSMGFLSGCEDYIRKPFALKELLVRVESLMKRNYGTHEDHLVLGEGIVFDLKTLTLTKGNKKIPLKRKELKLLRLFLRHPNELLDYEYIFEALWEYDEAPSPASLRTYIKSIRSIIGKEKIQTVKNIGYRFVQE
ncbi:MAG: response regulator transcription factor [Sulfurimonas sp.]